MQKEKALHSLRIEKITSEAELPDCAAILVDAYNAEPWNDAWTHEKALEKLLCFYHSPKFHGWKVLQNGQLKGCCVGNAEPYFTGDYFYLKEMFVMPAAQHQGIGVHLLTVIQVFLKTIDIHTIILFTSKNNFPFDFYLKSGFQEMDGMRMMMFGEGEE